jgi:uncharacterized protein
MTGMLDLDPALQLSDWRRQVSELYATVRDTPSPSDGHAIWRKQRDRLFREHPQSPLRSGDAMRQTGVAYWPYDPSQRFELPLIPAGDGARIELITGAMERTDLRSVGSIQLPAPLSATVEVWWLEQYGGGLFIPIRDQTAGQTTYGGGRYLLDTAKGSDLGMRDGRLVIDLNFLYHPSCRYDDAWQCPLAPSGNVVDVPLHAGEML